jgi:hypothetical protein
MYFSLALPAKVKLKRPDARPSRGFGKKPAQLQYSAGVLAVNNNPQRISKN